MSKMVHIDVSTSLSTDFYIEVPDDADEVKIKELAEKEVIRPHTYPSYIDNFLKKHFNIQIQGIDSMLKSWVLDELNYLIDGGITETSAGEQCDA